MTIPNHSDAPFLNNWRLRLFFDESFAMLSCRASC